MDKVLITGSSGFIGMHICERLLNDGFEVFGVDNMNDYYNPTLKKMRLEHLSSYSNFSFTKLDISNFESLKKVFYNFRPRKVINLAAQAGVRYSIENPQAYINSNILGFMNVLELCKKYEVKGLIYASSSSVYGGNDNMPFSEGDLINNPLSIYAVSKISNELMAKTYHNLFGLKSTGLRYFSVYGPWGRPDMAIYIFTDKIMRNKPISVYNNGDMKRDFTFIADIVDGTKSALIKNYECEVFNLGNSHLVSLTDLILQIEKNLGKKAKINYESMQPGDVKLNLADVKNAKLKLNYNPATPLSYGLKKFIDWYDKHQKILW